jgi:hypothetical protein
MRREFLRSPHHAALAAATLGVGFATGEPLYFILGAAAYVLGWVYLPDLNFFKGWVQKKQEAQIAAAEAGELKSFQARRDAALAELTNSRRQRYSALANICIDVDRAIGSQEDPRMRKIEELMWTFLRLLGAEQALDQFLESEARENVPALVETARSGVERLKTEVEEMRASKSAALDARERLLASRTDLLETLEKRAVRIEEARHNLELVVAEQERLDQQIKLLRADAVATRGTTALSARIDATVEQLEATNAWLREMDQFRDIIGEPALPAQRIGFGQERHQPPPLPVRGKERA